MPCSLDIFGSFTFIPTAKQMRLADVFAHDTMLIREKIVKRGPLSINAQKP
jgi:hypothetical protein